MSVKCENCDYSYMGYESSSMNYKLLCQESDIPCDNRRLNYCEKYSNKAEDIRLLESENQDLKSQVEKLTEQIEKMRCCCNCTISKSSDDNCGDCDDTFKNWKF